MRGESTDDHLVKRTLDGDISAFDVLVDRYRGLVHGLAYHVLGNFQDAEDIAQNAFIKAYDSLSILRDRAKFGIWLRVITLNLCKAWLRKSVKELLISLPTNEIPTDICIDEEFQESVSTALSALPPKNQVVITLFYMDDLSYREIGNFLDLPVSTVQSRLQRARKQLKGEFLKMAEEIFQDNRLGSKFTQKVLDEIMAEGRKHLDQKAWSQAEEAFVKAIGIMPDHAEAHFYIGRVKESQRLYGEAVRWYEKTVELKPDHAEAHYSLAISLSCLDKYSDAQAVYDKAITAYRKLIDLNPDDPELYRQLGEVYASQGDIYWDVKSGKSDKELYNEAARCYQRVVELKPDDAQAYCRLGMMTFLIDKSDDVRMVHYDRAIAIYEKLLEQDPDDPELYKQLGEAHVEKRDSEAGIAALKRAIALKPDYFEAGAWLGWAYQAAGNLEEAKTAYKETTEMEVAPERFYNNLEAYRICMACNNLGAIYVDEGNYDQGIFYMQKAVEKAEELSLGGKYGQRNLAICYAEKGAALSSRGEYAEAVASYRKAVTIYEELQIPDLIEARFAKKEHSNATAAFEDFVARNSGDAEAYYCLARLYSARGDSSKALEAFGKAVKLDSDYQERGRIHGFPVA